MPQWIIIYGNPITGLQFAGPFPDRESALEWADNNPIVEADWWITALEQPRRLS
jgi:hypothetical protein